GRYGLLGDLREGIPAFGGARRDSRTSGSGRDLLHRPTGSDAPRLLFENIRLIGRAGLLILLLDEQPVVAVAWPAHPHQRPAAAKLAAQQSKLEPAAPVAFLSIANRFPLPGIPQHDRPAAILMWRNRAFE